MGSSSLTPEDWSSRGGASTESANFYFLAARREEAGEEYKRREEGDTVERRVEGGEAGRRWHSVL